MTNVQSLFPDEPSADDNAIDAESHDQPPQDLGVRVIRSTKRKKTSSARVVNGVIEVRVPSWIDETQEAEIVEDLVRKVRRSLAVQEAPTDLTARARVLATRYDLPQPADIRWVTNQTSLWGSCSTGRETIRISSRLAKAPDWVVDYVVLHELTHLVEPNHGPRFKSLMDRYPRGERAEGFLEAMSLGLASTDWTTD